MTRWNLVSVVRKRQGVAVPPANWRAQDCLQGSLTVRLQLTLAGGEHGWPGGFKRNQNLDFKWNLQILKYWIIFSKHYISQIKYICGPDDTSYSPCLISVLHCIAFLFLPCSKGRCQIYEDGPKIHPQLYTIRWPFSLDLDLKAILKIWLLPAQASYLLK